MNILHYTIGLPPTRHGGSVQYAADLIEAQSIDYNVFALVCGDTLFRASKCKIKKKQSVGKIQVYTLTNPTTPTLLYGVKDPQSQLRRIDVDEKQVIKFS